MKNNLPLFNDIENDSGWLMSNSGSKSQAELLEQARSWASQLPGKQYMILLCEDRGNFITGFVAAQLKNQTVLLPSNRSVGALNQVMADYDDNFCLVDGDLDNDRAMIKDCRVFSNEKPDKESDETGTEQLFDSLSDSLSDSQFDKAFSPEHIAAVAFTSGSTGVATANAKSWASLVRGAYLAKNRFGFNPEHSIVATVPSQHMYGMETTVMVPLITGARILDGRPFYPEDVRLALESCSGKRVLVTTPIHLRACVAAGLQWPEIEMVISATAPLDDVLLQQANKTFAAPVLEIYGCTEAGSLASRNPMKTPVWTLYDDFSIFARDGDAIVSAKHLGEEVTLADFVEIKAKDSFLLLGRHTDMVNVAGKRASLSDLNIKLNAIAGVKDGVFIMPEAGKEHNIRLTALVVAPDLDESQILTALSEEVDVVFLPRPLYKVDSLPRNETGKLSRESLLSILDQIESIA